MIVKNMNYSKFVLMIKHQKESNQNMLILIFLMNINKYEFRLYKEYITKNKKFNNIIHFKYCYSF